MKLKLSPQRVKKAVVSEFLPGILSGVVNGWLEGKTGRQFYDFVKSHAGQDWFSGMLSPQIQSKVKGMADDLRWLDIDWFVAAIVKEHRDIAVLIYGSPMVAEEISRQIKIIKEELT